ncbi:MAG: hypothetical protein MZV70_54425 [Desulfobacterales bacterium]|nr:hypothetical protein [Desulfobacterales bacterium]
MAWAEASEYGSDMLGVVTDPVQQLAELEKKVTANKPKPLSVARPGRGDHGVSRRLPLQRHAYRQGHGSGGPWR